MNETKSPGAICEAPHQSIGKRPGFGRKTGTRSTKNVAKSEI